MRIIDDQTVAFESALEIKYAQYLMDLISKSPLWEIGEKSFIFKGKFIDCERYLIAFCFLSIEQNKTVLITDGIPQFNEIDIDYVEINGFSAVVNVDPAVNVKQKKLNKLAKHWANIYPFVTVEVLC